MIINEFKKVYGETEIIIPSIKITKRITLIQGENGCGKSTVLKAISKLIQYHGTIQFGDSISFIAEKNDYPKGVTVKAFIKIVHQFQEVDKKQYETLLKGLDMESYLNKGIDTLSKGNKQKVALLLGLTLKRDCYILDEPLEGLDQKSKDFILQYIKSSTEKYIITSHKQDDFKKITDEVITI